MTAAAPSLELCPFCGTQPTHCVAPHHVSCRTENCAIYMLTFPVAEWNTRAALQADPVAVTVPKRKELKASNALDMDDVDWRDYGWNLAIDAMTSTTPPPAALQADRAAVSAWRSHWPDGSVGAWNDGAPPAEQVAFCESHGLRIERAYTAPPAAVSDSWYCNQCQRAVNPQEVTHSEAHIACGRYITDDRAPKPTDEAPAKGDDNVRAALLWSLYHHQGSSSVVGQPARRALGMSQHENMTAEQIAEAKRFATSQDIPA